MDHSKALLTFFADRVSFFQAVFASPTVDLVWLCSKTVLGLGWVRWLSAIPCLKRRSQFRLAEVNRKVGHKQGRPEWRCILFSFQHGLDESRFFKRVQWDKVRFARQELAFGLRWHLDGGHVGVVITTSLVSKFPNIAGAIWGTKVNRSTEVKLLE